jgi:hypothetical protein
VENSPEGGDAYQQYEPAHTAEHPSGSPAKIWAKRISQTSQHSSRGVGEGQIDSRRECGMNLRNMWLLPLGVLLVVGTLGFENKPELERITLMRGGHPLWLGLPAAAPHVRRLDAPVCQLTETGIPPQRSSRKTILYRCDEKARR